MDVERIRARVEAWRLRALCALDGGPQLDAKTEAACASQLLGELDAPANPPPLAALIARSERIDEE